MPFSTITSKPKKIRAVNPEREAKRKAQRRKKHAAYMRSQTRRDVEARSGGVCEAAVGSSMMRLVDIREPAIPWRVSGAVGWSNSVGSWFRCENAATDHHHKTYARYGGDELPEDMLHACKRCHRWLESQHPTRKR